MKANKHTHHNSKLIADVIVPRRVTNRRGHAMTHESPKDPQHREHVRSLQPLRPRKPMTLAKISILPAAFYSLKTALPAWAPRKFTLEDGVQTNWQAALPSTQTLKNTGVIASFLVLSMFAVWAMPQKNTPQVIAERPVSSPNNTVAQTDAPQGMLVAASASDSTQAVMWKLPVARKASSGVIPVLAAQSQPNSSSVSTSSASTSTQGTSTTPASGTTPATGGETTTTPTEPTTEPVDPPVDPPTEPVTPQDPPIEIVDPMLDSVNDLLAVVSL